MLSWWQYPDCYKETLADLIVRRDLLTAAIDAIQSMLNEKSLPAENTATEFSNVG